MMSQLVSEYKAAVLPILAVAEPVLQLFVLHLAKGGHHEGGNADGAALAIFCGHHLILTFAAPDKLELLVNGDRAFGEVYAVPQQAQGLALPHSCEQGNREQLPELVALYGFQKGGNHIFIHGFQLLADCPGKDTGICWIDLDVAIGNGLLQCLVEDAVDVLDGLGCKPFFAQTVVIALDRVRGEGFQLHSTQTGLDPGLDHTFVIVHSPGFHTAQVFRRPDIQPLAHGHFAGGCVGAGVNGGGGLLQLLSYLFLCLAGYAALDLLAGAWVVALVYRASQ